MNFYGLDMGSIDFGLQGVSLTGKSIASGLFGLVSLFVAVIAIIMFWHWRKYSMTKGGTFVLEALYLAGSAGFMISAFTFLSKI
jgi:hypothetical protein